MLALVAGCGTDPAMRAAQVQPQFHADSAAIVADWNAGDAEKLVDHLDAERSFDDRAELVAKIARLRAQLGRVTERGEGLLDPITGDARILAVGEHVVATERGVARLRLAYDRRLRVVSFGVEGRSTRQH